MRGGRERRAAPGQHQPDPAPSAPGHGVHRAGGQRFVGQFGPIVHEVQPGETALARPAQGHARPGAGQALAVLHAVPAHDGRVEQGRQGEIQPGIIEVIDLVERGPAQGGEHGQVVLQGRPGSACPGHGPPGRGTVAPRKRAAPPGHAGSGPPQGAPRRPGARPGSHQTLGLYQIAEAGELDDQVGRPDPGAGPRGIPAWPGGVEGWRTEPGKVAKAPREATPQTTIARAPGALYPFACARGFVGKRDGTIPFSWIRPAAPLVVGAGPWACARWHLLDCGAAHVLALDTAPPSGC